MVGTSFLPGANRDDESAWTGPTVFGLFARSRGVSASAEVIATPVAWARATTARLVTPKGQDHQVLVGLAAGERGNLVARRWTSLVSQAIDVDHQGGHGEGALAL